jgi:hypothetical protein
MVKSSRPTPTSAQPQAQPHQPQAQPQAQRSGKPDYRPASVLLRVNQANQESLPSSKPESAADLADLAETAVKEAAPDWQTSVDQIRDRKTQERKTLREGDPKRFRQTAVELTRRSALIQEVLRRDGLIDDELIGGPSVPLSPRPEDSQCYESLSLPFQPTGYAHWRQIVGESFLEHQIIANDPASQQVKAVLGQAIWQIFQQFGIEAAYIFLLLLEKAGKAKNPWDEIVELNTEDLLQLNIWDKDVAISRGRRLRIVGNLTERVCNLSLLLNKVNPETQQFKALRVPFWVLEEMEYGGKVSTPIGGITQPEEPEDLTIRVGLGLWSEEFGDVTDEQKRHAFQELGYYATQILQINPYRKPLVSKLAIFLLFLNQLPPAFYPIGAYLEQLESKSLILEMPRRRDRRNYLSSRWNTALLNLHKRGWRLEFDPTTYPAALQPSWRQADPNRTPNLTFEDEAWVALWLQAQIKIQMPELPVDILSAPAAPERPLAERFTGRMLAHALVIKGLNRSKLAEHMKLDRSMITYWIKGARLIQPKHRELIYEMLGEELEHVAVSLEGCS